MNMRRSAIALLLLFALAMVVPRASATVEIRLSNNGVDTGWLTCGDTFGAAIIGCISLPGTNAITFFGTVGNYTINTSTGTQLNNGATPFLDLNSTNTTSTTPPGTLIIQTLITDFTLPSPAFNFVVNGNGGIGGTATFTAYGGNNNNACPTGGNTGCTPPSTPPANLTQIATTGALPILLTPSGFASTVYGPGTSANPYSLAITAVIAGTKAGGVSFDAALDPVPEPASVALLGGILLLSAGAIRRKLRRT